MKTISITTNSPPQTYYLAQTIGRLIPVGSVIAAYGGLGMGKTLFAQGLAKGMNITENVVSPTFIFFSDYQGDKPFCHIDAYRTEDLEQEDIEQIGFSECFTKQKVTFIEWPLFIEYLLPTDTIKMTISREDESNELSRRLQFRFDEQQHSWLVTALEQYLAAKENNK